MRAMEINLQFNLEEAELLITILENEMENLEEDHDVKEKLKRGLSDESVGDYYTALNMILKKIRSPNTGI